MPGEYKLSDSIRMILDLDADKRPTTATIHGIDGNHADISLAGSVAIVRHVEVVGNVNDVAVGDSVQIAWGNDNRPVVMLIGSGGTGGGIATVVADNQSIENSNSGLRVKAAGILRHHLGFTLPDESEFQDAFTAAGWTIDPDSGTIYHSGISISSGGMISLGSGEEVIKMSGFGVPDRPDSPEDDTDYRLWIGRIDPTFAPFAVDKYGHVVLRGGTVGGWSLTTDDIVSDAGNARIHSGARPYIGLGTDYYGGTGFWAGKDTDYIYKVSVGEAGGPQLTYDGTDLTLQDIDLKFYYGTNFTLWIQSDGDFAIGQDIDTVSSTSLRIFSNDQTYDGEAFTAGDIIIGDHGGAHMTWDQSAGQLQFRDGSETGIPVRAYVDTDGSIMFGDGQGRLDDQGIWIEAATSFGDEYPWNSINWAWDLGGTGEALQGRVSGAQGELWMRSTSRVSIGADVDITGGPTSWFQVNGTDGGWHLHWTYNDDYDGVNVWGDLQHWVYTWPFTTPPQKGFGHRTAWYLQDGASSFSQAAYLDVIWIEGIGGGEPGSAFKFYVFPDASMTEMFRIGPLDADTATNEYPYAAVVNPQFHSEGNFLVGGTSNNVLIETDAGTNSIYLGASALYIEAGSWGNPDTGWGTLYHSSADNKLYWYDGTTAYDLTQAGAVLWQEVDTNTIYTSDSVTIGGNVNTFTNNQLLVVNSLPESGWTPNDNNASNIIIATNQPLAGMTVAVEDGAASMVEYGFEFANTGTNDYGGISFASPSHVTYPYGVLLYHSGYGFWLDASSGKWTKIGSTSQWSFNVAVTHNPDLADYDFIFYGDTKEVMRIDAGSDFVAINSYIRIAEGSSPGTPPGTTGYLYASSTTSDLHWVTDGGTDYNLTDPASLWSSATGGLLYPATISDVVLIGTTTVENQALLTMEGAYTDVTGGAYSWAEVVLKDDEDSVGEMHWHVGRYDTTQWIGGLSMNLEFDPDTITWSRINSSNGGALQQYWITNASTQLMWYLMNDLGDWWNAIQALYPDGTGSVPELVVNINHLDADFIVNADLGKILRVDGSTGQVIVGTGASGVAPTGGSIDDSQDRLWIHQEDDYAGLAISSIRDDTGGLPVASITGYAARGTTASPTATQSGDYLLVLGGRGYGTQWETTSALMLFKAAENFTDTAHGADITFELKPTGTEARVETLYMSGTQVVINGDSGNIDFIVNGDSGEVFRVDAGLDVAQIATWLEMAEVAGPTTGEPGTGFGALFAKSDGKIWYKNDGGTSYDLTATGGSGEWVESGGFLTQSTGTDIVQVQNWIEIEDLSTANLPATGEPGTGWGAIFAKASDGKLYYKNDSGTTYDLTQGGASGYWTRNTSGYIYPSTTSDYLLINTNSTTGTNDTFNLFMQTVDYSGTGVLGVDMTGIAMGDINATGQPLATLQYLDYNTAGAWAADFLILGMNLFYNEATDAWAQTDTSQEGLYFEMFTRMDNTVSYMEFGYVVENTPSNLIPWITLDSAAGFQFNNDGEAHLDFKVSGDTKTVLFIDSGTDLAYIGATSIDTTDKNLNVIDSIMIQGLVAGAAGSIGLNMYNERAYQDTSDPGGRYLFGVRDTGEFYIYSLGTAGGGADGDVVRVTANTSIEINQGTKNIDTIIYGDVGEVFRVDAGLEVAQIATWLEFAELGTGATPTTGEPGTGFGAVYVKSDSKLYFKDDGGTEYDLTAGGGGAWSEATGYVYLTTNPTSDDVYIGDSAGSPDTILYAEGGAHFNAQGLSTATAADFRYDSQNRDYVIFSDASANAGYGAVNFFTSSVTNGRHVSISPRWYNNLSNTLLYFGPDQVTDSNWMSSSSFGIWMYLDHNSQYANTPTVWSPYYSYVRMNNAGHPGTINHFTAKHDIVDTDSDPIVRGFYYDVGTRIGNPVSAYGIYIENELGMDNTNWYAISVQSGEVEFNTSALDYNFTVGVDSNYHFLWIDGEGYGTMVLGDNDSDRADAAKNRGTLLTLHRDGSYSTYGEPTLAFTRGSANTVATRLIGTGDSNTADEFWITINAYWDNAYMGTTPTFEDATKEAYFQHMIGDSTAAWITGFWDMDTGNTQYVWFRGYGGISPSATINYGGQDMNIGLYTLSGGSYFFMDAGADRISIEDGGLYLNELSTGQIPSWSSVHGVLYVKATDGELYYKDGAVGTETKISNVAGASPWTKSGSNLWPTSNEDIQFQTATTIGTTYSTDNDLTLWPIGGTIQIKTFLNTNNHIQNYTTSSQFYIVSYNEATDTAATPFINYRMLTGSTDRTAGSEDSYVIFTNQCDGNDSAFLSISGSGTQPTIKINASYHDYDVIMYSDDGTELFRTDATEKRVRMKNWIELVEGTGPSTGNPATGWGAVYVKSSDSKLYFKDDGGTEYDLTGGALPVFGAYSGSAQGINSGANINWDNVTLEDTTYATSGGTGNYDDITINVTGLYKVTIDVSTYITSGTGRSDSRAHITLDDGGTAGAVEQSGTRCYMYNRTSGTSSNTGSTTAYLNITAGDVLRVYAVRNSGSDTVSTIANQCRISIELVEI